MLFRSPGFNTASAGLNKSARTVVSVRLLEWSNLIFVMENIHRDKIMQRFKKHLGGRPLVCLDIQDNYGFMDESLIAELKHKVTPYLKSYWSGKPLCQLSETPAQQLRRNPVYKMLQDSLYCS